MTFSIKQKLPMGAGGGKKPALLDNPMVFIIPGLAIMLMMAVMLFSGSGGGLSSSKAFEQGQRAMRQIGETVRDFHQTLKEEQVLSLAAEALEDPNAGEGLRQYLSGRMSDFEDFRLFESDAHLKDAGELGENAWIALDMMLNVLESGTAPLQLVKTGNKHSAAGMVAIGDPESPSGFLMVLADQEMILSGFNMTMPLGGYIALEQAAGRFTPRTISAFGDPAEAKDGLVRIPVPISLFRIVVPQVRSNSGPSGLLRLVLFLFGTLLLALGVIKRQRSMHKVSDLKPTPELLKPRPQPAGAAPETSKENLPGEKFEEEETVKESTGSASPGVSLSDLTHNLAKRDRSQRHKQPPVELAAEIFRAYDIRGIVGKTLDHGIARQVGQAVGTQAVENQAGPVVVGRDGRHSGPDLVDGMKEGIASTGCDVVDIGAVPTGVLYFAAHELGSGSGVMVTGSHNPPDYNGFKVMLGGTTLAGDSITALHTRIESGNIRIGKGKITEKEMLEAYRQRIADDIQLQRPLKVVADCGNGIGGICAAEVLRAIGAEVLPMFDEVDGSFPNHHPDPSDPENLKELIATVDLMNADLGIAFDGDADRLGVVTPSGDIIYADRIMMLFAREILGRNPGARIIYDVKCTGQLDTIIREAGGQPEMYKTGHSLIKNRMQEAGAPFAGEMSGHFFFGDRWYGFDCGIYSAARLLEILAMEPQSPEEVLKSLPDSISTPELKVHMQEGENHAFIAEFQEKARFANARVSTIDGLRADYEYGWGLVRASNTTPILVVRFEADSEESMQEIQEAFRMQMLSLKRDLQLPF